MPYLKLTRAIGIVWLDERALAVETQSIDPRGSSHPPESPVVLARARVEDMPVSDKEQL